MQLQEVEELGHTIDLPSFEGDTYGVAECTRCGAFWEAVWELDGLHLYPLDDEARTICAPGFTALPDGTLEPYPPFGYDEWEE